MLDISTQDKIKRLLDEVSSGRLKSVAFVNHHRKGCDIVIHTNIYPCKMLIYYGAGNFDTSIELAYQGLF